MADRPRSGLSDRQRRVLRKMGQSGRLVFKEGKRASIPKPKARAKAPTAKPSAGSKPKPKKAPMTAEQLSKRKAEIRAYARKLYKEDKAKWDNAASNELKGLAANIALTVMPTTMVLRGIGATAKYLGGAIQTLRAKPGLKEAAKQVARKSTPAQKRSVSRSSFGDGSAARTATKPKAKPKAKPKDPEIKLETTPASRSAPAPAKPQRQRRARKPKDAPAQAAPAAPAAPSAPAVAARRAYQAPVVKEMTGARAKTILEKAGKTVPAKASDRIAQAKKLISGRAKEPVKGMGRRQGKVAKGSGKPAQAKAPSNKVAVENAKAEIAGMTDVQLSKALKAGGFAVTKIGSGAKGTVSRAKAIQKLQGRANKAGRAQKAAKSDKSPRQQRRNQPEKDKPKARKPKDTPAKAAAPAATKGVNLAKELGYKTAGTQKALNTFFKERGVSTTADLIAKRGELVSALGKVRGGNKKIASGKALGNRIDKISSVRGGKGAGSPIPKARGATGARSAQGGTRDRAAREVEEKVAERASREVRSSSGPGLRGISSNPIKGTKALFTKLAKGEIKPAQMKSQLKPLLSKAKPAQVSDFNRALDFFTRMQINMRAAKKAGKVRPEDTRALNNAAKQLRQMLATIALAAGIGASAE